MKILLVLQVTLPKSKSSKNFQILKDIPQALNTNYFYYWGLPLCFFLFWVADTNHVIFGKHQKMALLNSIFPALFGDHTTLGGGTGQ